MCAGLLTKACALTDPASQQRASAKDKLAMCDIAQNDQILPATPEEPQLGLTDDYIPEQEVWCWDKTLDMLDLQVETRLFPNYVEEDNPLGRHFLCKRRESEDFFFSILPPGTHTWFSMPVGYQESGQNWGCIAKI